MQVPKYYEMYKSFLRALIDGKEHGYSDIKQQVINDFQLSPEDVSELLPSGKQTFFNNRIGWCRTYLKKAGLIDSPRRATFLITEAGENIYDTVDQITNDTLRMFPGFIDFAGGELNPSSVEISKKSTEETPQETLELIRIIQDAYINDIEKCIRISHLEIVFMNLLKWENMRCFQKMIKTSPELFAQIVDVVFKKDHISNNEQPKNQAYISNMYTIYEKAQFCPMENNSEVDEYQLEQWIEKYKELLIENDQESMFTSTLGRLFSFSPLGADSHEPCEAVRKMIEKYGDEEMISSYQLAVFNRRGIFSPTAGRVELKMAEEFKVNGQYLEPDFPKTSKIFFGLYEKYRRESENERTVAENGWY